MNIDACGAELAARKRWVLARIAELVNIGRAEGWLTGSPIANVPPSKSLANGAGAITTLLATQLDLVHAEIDALWILACVELDPMVACAAAQLYVLQATSLTVQMLERLVVLGGDGLDEQSIADLARLGLCEVSHDPQVPVFRRPIRASDRLLTLARGVLDLDVELEDIAVLEDANRELAVPSPKAAEVGRALEAATGPIIVAYGMEGAGRTTLLRQACGMRGQRVLRLDARALSGDEPARVRYLRAFVRECKLHDAAPLIQNIDSLEHSAVFEREVLGSIDGPVLLTSATPYSTRSARPLLSVRVDVPDVPTSTLHWRLALAGAPEEVIQTSGERFHISPALIGAAAATVLSGCVDRSAIVPADVNRALRAQLEQKLLGFASRIETAQTWDDLVVPVDQFDLLVELVSRVRHRKQVLHEWGFGRKIGRGQGIAALLSGPPGTGKTMIAGLLANELGLDLYQVDLSRIVSKYIGETEKQLAAVFEAAESGQAIILFDEADSLFGKRTEVKSSNDRYANLEVNYLLQRMEAFKGITLLTTNHENAIDDAFKRRLAFHIRVPVPDEDQREMLWRTLIPSEAACDSDLDFAVLASTFEMTGGYIKNAVVRAAYLAAAEESPIQQQHLVRAARAEYEGMGKVTYHAAA